MLDFTSSVYLGLRHGSGTLAPWSQLTRGVPAVLGEPSGAPGVAQRLAELMGCARGLLGTSTLHLFWDVFGVLAASPIAIHWDEALYPIVRWGIERASARGTPARRFAHHSPEALWRSLRRSARLGRRPVVVIDGFCPGCGRPAPLREYLEATRAHGGLLVMDDTQALGILGAPAPGAPYGRGGGGSPRWSGVAGDDILCISSLAKGFGVPVAVVAGGAPLLRFFEARSETRVHCSPPAVAVIRAAEHALDVNDRHGEALRRGLARRVEFFRARLRSLGLSPVGGLFPVQQVGPLVGRDPVALEERLGRAGVRAVLLRPRCDAGTRGTTLSFLLTVRHGFEALERAARALAGVLRAEGIEEQQSDGGLHEQYL